MNNVRRTQYPKLTVDTRKLYNNIKTVADDCSSQGISIAGVIKGFNGIYEAALQFVKAGCSQLATSRMEQIIDAREKGIDAEFMLVRIPMLSEAEEVAAYADMSLNSEIEVIRAIDRACEKFDRTHGIILMADLGDLREGYWDKDELVETAVYIENELKNVKLMGVGTNLGCYGSIKPTVDKMNELADIACRIEERIGRELEIVSGGATSSYPLVLDKVMPAKINHLRMGEGIILAYDLQEIWGLDMSRLSQEVFTFKAEVIEVKNKPTHPVGEIFIDGFGRMPEYEDRGIRKRALLATGKLDYALNDKIFPKMKGIELIGASSDHAILDIEDCEEKIKLGDIIEFNVSYPSLMYLTNSRYINIETI
ncbi:MAG: alanine racemase [Anaerovoracaceae bacterium]|nr:alanine racemase [Anaerovoracaceae bacterium]